MIFTKTKLFLAMCAGMLGWKDGPPIDAESNSLKLSAEDRKKIVAALGEADAEKAINGVNAEIQSLTANNTDMLAIKHELDALEKESNLTAEEMQKITAENANGGEFATVIAMFKANQKKQADMIAALVMEPEPDSPFAIIRNVQTKIEHSATHLFASANSYDAFIDRPWNQRAAGQTSAATNFMDQPTVNKLNDDMNLYFRQNPDVVNSLQRDNFGLPTFWPKRTKIDDRIADATIVTAEISQSRKLPWLPKNKQKIQPEEGKIFPIQIDIEFVGFFLQKIEASWLNMMNKEGSQPYKESFVRFLVSELDKKARVEDRIATIKGVYVETPEDATVAGRFINRQNGLLYLAQQARDVTKKYRPFDLGLPTSTNICDYVDNFIKRLPIEVREQQGLVLYLSDEWLRAYKRRYETLYGLNEDYKGYPETPKDYPNVKFERLTDMAGSDFMFMTFDDNIEILENVPAEKSLYTFELAKRNFYIFADYKMGVRFIHIGTEVEAGDPLEFAVQTVWSNTVPVFAPDFYVPVNDDETGKVKAIFKNLYVSKFWKTDITEFKNTTPGTVLKIKGDVSLLAAKYVKDNANNDLTSDFNLASGGTLTLFIQPDGKTKELSRTDAPEVNIIPDVIFTTGTIDADQGTTFKFNGVATTPVTLITKGVEGKSIKIHGTNASGVNLSFATTQNIVMNSAETLGDDNDYVQLTLVDGKWLETDKNIT